MKFTSEDLMKAMGLSIGDRIKISVANNEFIYEIRLNAENKPYLLNEQNLINCGDVHSLIDMDIEILPRPKRVGDILCKDCECVECHLRCLPYCNQLDNGKKTLFNTLNSWNEYDTFDQEIHDLLKARLDKVVE